MGIEGSIATILSESDRMAWNWGELVF